MVFSRRVFLFVIFVLAAPSAVFAQGKPRYCLTQVEVKAEREIRHGIFMRESTNRCERYAPGVRAGWDSFASANAQRFITTNGKRLKAFQREFGQNWQSEMDYADGRIVTYHRHYPLTQGYCDNVEKLVKELAKGYRAFTQQAANVQNQVIAEFKVCRASQ